MEGETGNLGKRLEWRDRDETWWVECFGEFGDPERARIIIICMYVRDLHKLT